MKITYAIQLEHILVSTRKKLGVEWKRLDILKAVILALVSQIIFCLSFFNLGAWPRDYKSVFVLVFQVVFLTPKKLCTFPGKWEKEYRLHYNAYNVC